jgi:hypothetical protein
MKSLVEIILQTAKQSNNFKKIVYEECYNGNVTYGDYCVTIDRLLTVNITEGFWNTSTVSEITDLARKIESADPDASTKSMIFVPFIEDLDIDSLLEDYPTGIPEAVVQFEYNSEEKTCPTYTLDEADFLSPTYSSANEDYAWSHDVWVFGQEEVVSPGNMLPPVNGTDDHLPGHTDRSDADKEWGGDIQVTNLGELESWIQGKPEFKYFVYTASGSTWKELPLGKRKRKNFKNDKWYNFNDFIGYWNLNNIGNWSIEQWIEEDNGDPITVTSSYPAPCSGCPTTNISYTISDEDYDMGKTMIQFSDPISTEYSLNYANIRRHSSN